jgi:hypothetical protein
MEGMNSTMICCKNFGKCHNVHQYNNNTVIKKKNTCWDRQSKSNLSISALPRRKGALVLGHFLTTLQNYPEPVPGFSLCKTFPDSDSLKIQKLFYPLSMCVNGLRWPSVLSTAIQIPGGGERVLLQ